MDKAVVRRWNLKFPAEVAAENGGIGEAGFSHNVGDGEIGRDEQFAGIFQP